MGAVGLRTVSTTTLSFLLAPGRPALLPGWLLLLLLLVVMVVEVVVGC